MSKLKDKVAVVTGGNSGIGFGAATLFAAEGAKVVITGRNEKTLQSAAAEIGKGAIGIAADVANIKTLEPLYEKVKSNFGKIDVLVVNAGVVGMAPTAEVTEEAFDAIMDINVKGVYFTVARALPYLNDGASIIITSSTVANKGIAGAAPYTASKAAERNMVRSFAAEFAARKIRVNSLSPGAIGTPIWQKNGFSKEHSDGMNSFFENAVALKRMGTVEEMAKGFLFLASDDSSYMTGGDLLLDGGFSDL